MFLLHQSMEKYHCVFPTIFDIQKYLNLIYKWRTLFRICGDCLHATDACRQVHR